MTTPSLSPRTFNREQLAWAAGFYDGEGHTRMRGTLAITISQADSPELLERFRDAVGVGAVFGPYEYRHRRPTQKPFYVFHASSFEASQHCLCCLWPWLGAAKRRQALTAIRKLHDAPRKWARAKYGTNRIVCVRGHRVEGENAYVTRDGHTACRECRRHWGRADRARKRGTVR